MVGAKRALKPQQVWAIRFWLDRERRLRDRAMFDLAVDSKLRGSNAEAERLTSSLFRAGSITPIISAPGNMLGSLMSG
jgi:hypothetical protein